MRVAKETQSVGIAALGAELSPGVARAPGVSSTAVSQDN